LAPKARGERFWILIPDALSAVSIQQEQKADG
jgi:hypothetical protein